MMCRLPLNRSVHLFLVLFIFILNIPCSQSFKSYGIPSIFSTNPLNEQRGSKYMSHILPFTTPSSSHSSLSLAATISTSNPAYSTSSSDSIPNCDSNVIENKTKNKKLSPILSKFVSSLIIASTLVSSINVMTPVLPASAAELPSLEKCFNAVKKELDPLEGVTLNRFRNDVREENWDDLVVATREYDAGFRGGVLKAAWKQLGDKKQEGINISNSFTFDLISLNKAARQKDKDLSNQYIDSVVKDLQNFLRLQN